MIHKSQISLSASLLVAALALGAAPALASRSGEVNSGRAVAARVDSGRATCRNLSSSQLEHLGEYVMQRMLGSGVRHESMNRRMEAMMGSEYSDRMHQALGGRYAGCPINRSTLGPGMMGGGGMMGGYETPGAGWSVWAVIAAVLGALALGGLIGVLVMRRPRHHGVSGPETT